MQEGLTAPVIGPSAILPRGYLWLAPIWYVGVAAALALSHWPPMWFRITAAAGLFTAMLVFLLVLNSITTQAFTATGEGIDLGLPAFSKRRGQRRRDVRHLPWRYIERVRIAPRAYGSRVELLLSPNATLALRGHRHGSLRRAAGYIMLLIPFWYLLRPTGLTSPLDGPPRYLVKLRGVTVDELRHRLRAVAPPEVAVAVLVRRR
jgi:hypothetical protein